MPLFAILPLTPIQSGRSSNLGRTSIRELHKLAYYTMGPGCLGYYVYESVSRTAIVYISASYAQLISWSESLFSAFFRKGQVIETFRGDGIWQPAVDMAIEKLNQGHWVRAFYRLVCYSHQIRPSCICSAKERCINLLYIHRPMALHIYRDSNGVCTYFTLQHQIPSHSNVPLSGRIIMETNVPPLIIPMWLTGTNLQHLRYSYPHLAVCAYRFRQTYARASPVPIQISPEDGYPTRCRIR